MKPLSLLCFAVLLFTSCGRSTLSDEEAISLIRQAMNFPAYVAVDVEAVSPPLAREFTRLFKEGYVILDSKGQDPYVPSYRPTDKGKDLVKKCVRYSGIIRCWVFTHKADITRIVDKRIDKDTAIVIYEVAPTPTPYLAELRKLDPQRVDEMVRQAANRVSPGNLNISDKGIIDENPLHKFNAKARFERWEKGWRAR